MYNLIHGRNPAAGIILATLGFRPEDVGRFRDAFITEGKIAIYTRNGSGNRNCWHEDDSNYGSPSCKHEVWTEMVDEYIRVPESEVSKYPRRGATFISESGVEVAVWTGKQVEQTNRRCLEPNSASCACPGCIITYRLPKHPNYINDQDDDFDGTYATIYFSFPEKYKEFLTVLDIGEWNPDQRWLNYFDKLQNGGPISQVESEVFGHLLEAIRKTLEG